MRTFQKILGVILIASFFAGLFYIVGNNLGYKTAGLIFIGSLVITAIIYLGVYLIVNN